MARLRKIVLLADYPGGHVMGGDGLALDDVESAADLLTLQQSIMEEMAEALRPFAEPHAMGDSYVSFAPRLLVDARTALTRFDTMKKGVDRG